MTITIILAQILGVTFLLTSLSMIINKKSTYIALEKMLKDPAVLWTLGFFTIFLGSILMALNNFSTTLSKVMSILGLISLLKGVYLLWLPGHSIKMYSKMIKTNSYFFLSGILMFILSIYLIMAGF